MEVLRNLQTLASGMSCSKCGTHYPLNQLQYFAPCCDQPLVVSYSTDSRFRKEDLIGSANNMWRYAKMMPLFDPAFRITLGEGMTPILPLRRLSERYELSGVLLKDEGLNPTGSFKSRGLSMALSRAWELGQTEYVIPTAGNAGGALSAYCASAGLKATVIMPSHTPKVFQDECRYYGAELILLDGLIDKCGALALEIQQKTGAFNMSTLKEPYRLEGKKTMGYEIAEQLDWELPDAIVYPTGGGTGLIGIWKAFKEMISLGWLKKDVKLPRMIAVQSANCSPVVDFLLKKDIAHTTYSESIANGLAVPQAFGKEMIRQVIEESNGLAVTVSEQQIVEGMREMSANEGILVAPEGGAIWMATKDLIQAGKLVAEEKIMLLNTGSGYKYLESIEQS